MARSPIHPTWVSRLPSWISRFLNRAALLASFILAASANGDCVSGCSGQGLTIADIVLMVNVALGTSPVSSCLPGDRDGSGEITVDELLASVGNLLDGCGDPSPTPTNTLSPTMTRRPTLRPTSTQTATVTQTPIPACIADFSQSTKDNAALCEFSGGWALTSFCDNRKDLKASWNSDGHIVAVRIENAVPPISQIYFAGIVDPDFKDRALIYTTFQSDSLYKQQAASGHIDVFSNGKLWVSPSVPLSTSECRLDYCSYNDCMFGKCSFINHCSRSGFEAMQSGQAPNTTVVGLKRVLTLLER